MNKIFYSKLFYCKILCMVEIFMIKKKCVNAEKIFLSCSSGKGKLIPGPPHRGATVTEMNIIPETALISPVNPEHRRMRTGRGLWTAGEGSGGRDKQRTKEAALCSALSLAS